jgi:hypothetical protein
LIPWQQVSCEIRNENQEKETKPYNPIKPTRAVKTTCEIGTQKVKKRDNHEKVAAPMMYIADECPEENCVLKNHNGFIGPTGNRLIYKHEEDTG